jgi:hypothetical protein
MFSTVYRHDGVRNRVAHDRTLCRSRADLCHNRDNHGRSPVGGHHAARHVLRDVRRGHGRAHNASHTDVDRRNAHLAKESGNGDILQVIWLTIIAFGRPIISSRCRGAGTSATSLTEN